MIRLRVQAVQASLPSTSTVTGVSTAVSSRATGATVTVTAVVAKDAEQWIYWYEVYDHYSGDSLVTGTRLAWRPTLEAGIAARNALAFPGPAI